jgi:hypothetical protein
MSPLPTIAPSNLGRTSPQSGTVRGVTRAAALTTVCLRLARTAPGETLRKECSFRTSKGA